VAVTEALTAWTSQLVDVHPRIQRVGYFGSYARGDWGVGSDLDVVVIVDETTEPFERRTIHWDTARIPVPVDVLVYTTDEWRRLEEAGQLSRIQRDLIWIHRAT
jgi:predicted nucleotidyltransferase